MAFTTSGNKSHTRAYRKENEMWLIFQDTKHGGRYFTGKAHPISPDAWSPDIRKAKKFNWQHVVNMREWVSAHTCGEPIQRLKDD
jgi:hypothetical protein